MVKIKIYDPKIVKYARKLRKNSTPWEKKLWGFLKSSKFYGFKFRRQFSIGNYIVDFCCVKEKFIVELDGGHHNTPQGIGYDKKRYEFLKKSGYRVLRIWNNEIENNLEGVGEKIYLELTNPHP
jgi:very-short-patch-repair endonuclease